MELIDVTVTGDASAVREDKVVFSPEGGLILEFAVSGIDKKFRHIGRGGYGFSCDGFCLEEDGDKGYALVYERQESSFAGRELMRFVVDHFVTRAIAEAAYQKVCDVLIAGKPGPGLSSEGAPVFNHGREKDLTAVIVGTVACVSMVLAGSGLFMAGIALVKRFFF